MIRVNYDDLETDSDGSFYWQGRPFTGVAFELHTNGRVAAEVEMVDGTESGTVREWYLSGHRKLEGYGRLSEQYAWVKEWFENGQPKSEREYEYGVCIREMVWNEHGQLISNRARSGSGSG